MTADPVDERAHLLACEARMVCDMPTREERRAYLARVRKARGDGPARALYDAVLDEWERRRKALADEAEVTL